MSKGGNSRHDISQIDAEIDINALTSYSSGKGWTFSGETLTLTDNLVYRINGTGTATSNSIAMSPGTNSAVILNNVNIDVSGTDYACAFDVTSVDIELFIQGDNSLRSGRGRAGLEVPDGASITISSIHDNNTDSLNAEGGTYGGAGIGGLGSDNDSGKKGRAGTITIYSGTITATGNYYGGAGIGGGGNSDSGVICILDGLQSSITAQGGNADIGCGQYGGISDVEYVDATTLEAMIAEALAENNAPNDSQALPDSVGAANVLEAETPPAMSEENHSPEILAVLPPFMPSIAGTYTFTASLDHMPPEGSSLILLSDSEDLNASFIFTDSPDVVRVSADFSAGRLYSPVVAAEYDSHSQGGCMAVNLGALILFAGVILAGVKRL